MQQLLAEKKTALDAREVPAQSVPKWPELAMKIIYPQVIARHPDILQFLPDIDEENPRYPERLFFYRVLYAKYEDTYN